MKTQSWFLCLCLAVVLTACHRNDFRISGDIADGFTVGQKIYFEHIGLKGIDVLDSAKLNSRGSFSFYAERPDYPDLYQLRLGEQRFVFSVDSTEHIYIVADGKDLLSPEVIEGSHNTEIICRLRNSVRDMQTYYTNKDAEHFKLQVAQHRHFADSVIMSSTHSIAAYYAIFQRVGDYYVYNPYIKSDRIYCAAVATGFKAYMPLNPRSQLLEAWVLAALRDEKRQDNIRSIQEMVNNAEDAFLEIAIPDRNGEIRKLSDLKGKVVLLDFSAAEMEQNVAYTLQLRELYNHYHGKGFEIYQVSADQNEQRWLQATELLPWVCVRNPKNPVSSAFLTYNVHSIPTMFVLDKQGHVIARHSDFTAIEKDIKKCMK